MRYSGDVKKIVWQEGIVFSIEKCESITVFGKAVYYSECEAIGERSWDIRYDKKRSSNYIHAYRVQNKLVGTKDVYVVHCLVGVFLQGQC